MKHVPQRTCVVCRKTRDKSQLIRIVRHADGTVVFDRDAKEPGRGAYICSDGDCAEKAVGKKLLNRAFKCNIDSAEYDKLRSAVEELRRGER